MFNKLSPVAITNQKDRNLFIVAMLWFFIGAWIDSSAHTYLIDDIETFFTPWHAVLYSGYAFSVLVAIYVKNKIKDYKFDVGVLGAVVFGIGGASDAVWHTLLGIETGVEPLVSPSHLMLFLGAFLMLDYVFTARPSTDKLDTASVVAVSTIYGLIMFITQFLHPYLQYGVFFSYDDAFAAGTLFFQAMLASIVFVYAIRFKMTSSQMFLLYFLSFVYVSVHSSLGDTGLMLLIIGIGSAYSFGVYSVTNWYYKTDHDRKIQVSTAMVASLYGLFFVVYLLILQAQNSYDITWRFYGLGGLVTTPLLFGYMVGNLGVNPRTGEVVE
ncbi:MAG: hypothetical protein ACJ0FT_02880 [Candidatus Actinomarina sp.]|tara:strand:+ start:659 stop:1636 length:978 start_codon:yes stop_codon:yes gene_type:complete